MVLVPFLICAIKVNNQTSTKQRYMKYFVQETCILCVIKLSRDSLITLCCPSDIHFWLQINRQASINRNGLQCQWLPSQVYSTIECFHGDILARGGDWPTNCIPISLIHCIYLPQDTSGGNVITSPGDVRQDHSIHGGESRTQSTFRLRRGVRKVSIAVTFSCGWTLGSLGMRNQGAIVSFWLVISSPVLIELDPTH